MKVSLNTIKQYIDFELPPVDELVKRINEQLGGVEEVVDLAAKYKDAKIVKVVECEKHPNADRLSVCKVDAGTGELIQVVCGAPNVHADMFAVWLPPESIVPATFDGDEPFKLGARELRGVMSHGMLAAGDELAINGDHDGIIEIDPNEWKPNDIEIKPGVSFAEVYGLDDTIIDIENKMFTHRPDLFGQIGVAREIAGIQGKQFVSPEWYAKSPEFDSGTGLELDVFNEAYEKVPRFMAVAIKNVEVKPSPLWLQAELVRLGSKSINNIVDMTNYVMLLTAQPTHAYDYDKLRGHKLGARMANDGENITLLNGKSYKLTTDDIVITDGEGAVGLGGIMGGGNSEVSSETKNIVLEVANFDMYTVRKSAMRHGVFTDALTRFNKGQSPLQNDRIIDFLMMSIKGVAGGEQASEVFDQHAGLPAARVVQVRPEFINERLGMHLSSEETKTLLQNVELGVEDGFAVAPAFWRTDIELPEDIVEEVGRLYGFDKLPRELPKRSAAPAPRNDRRELLSAIRHALARAGANEVLTYSFVHERILKSAGQDVHDAYRLSNALSPDLQYYRLSVTPSLLDKVHANIKAGHTEFALFEVGKSHSKKAGLDQESLPVEPGRIALVYAAKTPGEGAAYYRAKRILDYVADQMGRTFDYKALPADSKLTAAVPFCPGRVARVIDRDSGQSIGIIGEYAPSTQKAFKLPDYSAGFELFTEGLLLARIPPSTSYEPLSRYPSTERDVCFEVATDIAYGQINEAVRHQLAEIEVRGRTELVDIYQTDTIKKRITIRIRLTPYTATMTSEEANGMIQELTDRVARQVGATII